MRARIKLRLMQAAMRARQRSPKRVLKARANAPRLKRRIAAAILFYDRGLSARQIAAHFGWPEDAVQRWFDAGRPLL